MEAKVLISGRRSGKGKLTGRGILTPSRRFAHLLCVHTPPRKICHLGATVRIPRQIL